MLIHYLLGSMSLFFPLSESQAIPSDEISYPAMLYVSSHSSRPTVHVGERNHAAWDRGVLRSQRLARQAASLVQLRVGFEIPAP